MPTISTVIQRIGQQVRLCLIFERDCASLARARNGSAPVACVRVELFGMYLLIRSKPPACSHPQYVESNRANHQEHRDEGPSNELLLSAVFRRPILCLTRHSTSPRWHVRSL